MDQKITVQKTRATILQNQCIRRCQGLHGKDKEKPKLKAKGMENNMHQEQPPEQAQMDPGWSLVAQSRERAGNESPMGKTWHVRLPQNAAEGVTSISLRTDEMSFKPGTAAVLMKL